MQDRLQVALDFAVNNSPLQTANSSLTKTLNIVKSLGAAWAGIFYQKSTRGARPRRRLCFSLMFDCVFPNV